MIWLIQRFDPFLGWVTFARCTTRAAANHRYARADAAIPLARLRIIAEL
jgi:hypothetical protein